MNISFRPSSVYFGTNTNNSSKSVPVEQKKIQYLSEDIGFSLLAPLNEIYRNIKNNPTLQRETIQELNKEKEKLEIEILKLESRLNNKTNDEQKVVLNLQKAKEDLAINKVCLVYLNQLKSSSGFDEEKVRQAVIDLSKVFREDFEDINLIQERRVDDEFIEIVSNEEIGVRPSDKNGGSFLSKIKTMLFNATKK